MNKKRLLKLADLLEKDAENPKGVKFDLCIWGSDLTKNKKKMGVHCGTAACAMGLAALSGVFKRAGLVAEIDEGYDIYPSEMNVVCKGKYGTEAAEVLFGISASAAFWLFIHSYYSGRVTGKAGELKVAKRIRNFVAGKQAPPPPEE